jgi:hypothetical protein
MSQKTPIFHNFHFHALNNHHSPKIFYFKQQHTHHSPTSYNPTRQSLLGVRTSGALSIGQNRAAQNRGMKRHEGRERSPVQHDRGRRGGCSGSAPRSRRSPCGCSKKSPPLLAAPSASQTRPCPHQAPASASTLRKASTTTATIITHQGEATQQQPNRRFKTLRLSSRVCKKDSNEKKTHAPKKP